MKATKLRFKDFGEVEHDPGALHPIRVATVHTYKGQGHPRATREGHPTRGIGAPPGGGEGREMTSEERVKRLWPAAFAKKMSGWWTVFLRPGTMERPERSIASQRRRSWAWACALRYLEERVGKAGGR